MWISLKWFLQGEAITDGLVLRFWVDFSFLQFSVFQDLFSSGRRLAVVVPNFSMRYVWVGRCGTNPYQTPTAATYPLPQFVILASPSLCTSDHSLQVVSFSICPNVLSILSKLSWRSGEEIHSGVWLAVPVAIAMGCSGFWHLFQKAKLFFLQKLSHYSK